MKTITLSIQAQVPKGFTERQERNLKQVIADTFYEEGYLMTSFEKSNMEVVIDE